MSIKAIIFDMDGTIIDTEHIWEKATQDLIVSKGVAYTPDLHEELRKSLHGMAMPKSIQLIKDVAQLTDSVEDLMKEKNIIADNLFCKGVRFIQGFEQFHALAQQKNLKTAIATNAGDNTLLLVDKTLNLRQFFGEHMYGISAVNYLCKPDPAIYLHAAEKLGVDPKECIAIEDSARGIEAAKSAGMFCIGINTSKNKTAIETSHHMVDFYHEIELQILLAKKHPF